MKVGDYVMCINDNFDDRKANPIFRDVVYPKKERIYTIRAIVPAIKTGLLLEEIHNPSFNFKDGYGEVTFDINRFRKLNTDDNNVAINMEEYELLLSPCDI